jgi:hypothetical protein
MSGVIDVNSTWMKIHDRELLLFVPRSRIDQSDSRSSPAISLPRPSAKREEHFLAYPVTVHE